MGRRMGSHRLKEPKSSSHHTDEEEEETETEGLKRDRFSLPLRVFPSSVSLSQSHLDGYCLLQRLYTFSISGMTDAAGECVIRATMCIHRA